MTTGLTGPLYHLTRDLALKGSSTTTPRLVYGTAWKKDKSENLVYTALKNGFRGIDTAAQPKHYQEKGVAAGVRRAIEDGVIQRDHLFIQTKFTSPAGQSEICPYDFDAPLVEKVHQSVQSSLKNFTLVDQEPYLDSVVLHSPMQTPQDTLAVWETLETYHPKTIRNLGIANTTLQTLELLCQRGKVKPSVVQNRFHATTNYEIPLRAFCRENGIIFQSFWTISANRSLVRSSPVVSLAQAAGVGIIPAFYSLVLGLEGMTILDGTTDEEHMKEDLEGVERVARWAEKEGETVWNRCSTEFSASLATL